MKFAISSNKTFAPVTYETVVGSLIQSGVNPEDIYFFEGDHEDYEKIEDLVHRYKVPYNSMDFNSLIAILELNLEADYWFLLQDTCYFGPNFKQALGTTPTSPAKALCKEGLSMNIGAYSMKYLRAMQDEIFALKHTGDLTEFKSLLVAKEDFLLNPFKTYYYTDKFTMSEPRDIYGNNIPRIVQCYPQLDMCKTKANWFAKQVYETKL